MGLPLLSGKLNPMWPGTGSRTKLLVTRDRNSRLVNSMNLFSATVYGIRHVMTSPYNHQANGKMEATVKRVIDLKKTRYYKPNSKER